MMTDPKFPPRPVEEPNQWPDEVPPDGGDTDFPGTVPEETPPDTNIS